MPGYTLFDACHWLFVLALLVLLLLRMLAAVSPCCLHAYTRCMLVVVGDPLTHATSRSGFESSRGVTVVWSSPGRVVGLE